MAKLILTQEVSSLGAAGDIVEVRDGYARNYLLPRGYALTWTKGGEKDVERLRSARRAREIATVEEAQAVAEKLQSTSVKVPVKTGESGRLFGTVGPAQIAEAVEAAGLRWLAAAGPGSASLVEVLDVTPEQLVLSRLVPARPTRRAAAEFGTALATTHAAGAPAYGAPPDGWTGDGYIGTQRLTLPRAPTIRRLSWRAAGRR